MITDSLAAVWWGAFCLGAGLTMAAVAIVLFVSTLRIRLNTPEPVIDEPDIDEPDIDEDQAAELLPEWNIYA
ncbi:hypothetical protein [Nocardia nova]